MDAIDSPSLNAGNWTDGANLRNNGDMTVIPKIIHRTSNTRTWEELHVIERAKKMMPDFQHLFWDDAENLAFVRRIFPQYIDIYNGFERGVTRADIARCLYLYDKGGIYCDTDYIIYKPFDNRFLSNRCVIGIEDADAPRVGGGYRVGNAFLASEQGFPLWRDFVENIFLKTIEKKSLKNQSETDVVYAGGPHALSLFLKGHKEHEEQVTFLPPSVIYPALRWRNLSSVRDKETIGVHLCWGRWRSISLWKTIKQRLRRWLSAML